MLKVALTMASVKVPGGQDPTPPGAAVPVVECGFSGLSERIMPHLPETPACPARRPQDLRRWLGMLLMLAAIFLAGPMAAQQGKPLTVKDIMDLLNGGAETAEIARVVNENGISFRMFDDLERQFRGAGADDVLIDALKKASKPEEVPPPAPATGMLKIQSQPGAAQVYVNDAFKGMTNAAGELRLAEMAPGTYTLRVALAGYKTWENSITVTAGETVDAFVTMEKQNLTPTVTLDTDRSSIETGQSVYLRWTSSNATDVDIEPGVGKVALAGSTSVSPRESTTYTLTAIGPGGIKTATTFVSVTTPPPPPPPAPTPAPVYQPVVTGNLPGFPVPGASFKEIKFFEGPFQPPAFGSRIYQARFRSRASRYINWELHITCPPVTSPVIFTIYATWYNPNERYSARTAQCTRRPWLDRTRV